MFLFFGAISCLSYTESFTQTCVPNLILQKMKFLKYKCGSTLVAIQGLQQPFLYKVSEVILVQKHT